MHAFKQGELDQLCGVYSLVNAEQIINRSSRDESQQLFNAILSFLDQEKLLIYPIKEGMLCKHIKAVLVQVIGKRRIRYQKLHFVGVTNPDLNTFWNEISWFLDSNPKSAVLLGIAGVYDHWTVIKKITQKQMTLYDSGGLRRLHRFRCTTSYVMGKRQHVLYQAQTYFLKNT